MNDAYYDPDISVFPGNLQPGTPIYAQVDSFNPSTSYGTVLEKHEAIGEPYNNIYGPVLSVEATTSGSELPPMYTGRSRAAETFPRDTDPERILPNVHRRAQDNDRRPQICHEPPGTA